MIGIAPHQPEKRTGPGRAGAARGFCPIHSSAHVGWTSNESQPFSARCLTCMPSKVAAHSRLRNTRGWFRSQPHFPIRDRGLLRNICGPILQRFYKPFDQYGVRYRLVTHSQFARTGFPLSSNATREPASSRLMVRGVNSKPIYHVPGKNDLDSDIATELEALVAKIKAKRALT